MPLWRLKTRRYAPASLGYPLALVPASLAPLACGVAGLRYGVVALGLGGELLHRAWTFRRTPVEVSRTPAKALFAYSILYLYAIFAQRR